MKRFLLFYACCLIWTASAFGQSAVVRRNVNLRAEASTKSDIIESLSVGTELTLLENSKKNGFYHVTAPDGRTDWTWLRNVSVSLSATAPASTPSTTPLFAMLKTARKTAVGEPLILNGTQICGPSGDAANNAAKALNKNKNRTDVPADSDYVDMTWNQLKTLPVGHVSDFVSAPVRVVGFLSHKINGTGESTNCHKTADDEVDWHIYLTQASNQPISAAIIVETTPRTVSAT